MTAQEAVAVAATAEGVPGATLRALQDVQSVARLSQVISRQLPLFLGSMFAGGDSMIGSRTAWQTALLDYTDAERQLRSLSQPALREAWRAVRTFDAVTMVDGVLTRGVGGDTLRRQLNQRAELEVAIAGGLADGEMQVAYQPVIDVATDRLMGYEALIRWTRPGVGHVAPDQWIPVAESSRLISDVDRWMLHAATSQMAQWRAECPAAPGEPEPTIAVNISGRHLADPRVITDVADALAASGLLVLEVPETVLVDDPLAYEHLSALCP
jgi:sensor c-di-GMP phosphodiesterase-like protein